MVHEGATGDLSQWWLRFSDPLLSELLKQALASSPDLRKARARLREARARRAMAGSYAYPSVSASGSAGITKTSPVGGSRAMGAFSAGFDASWELDVFGGVRRGIEAAQADLESTVAALQDTRVTLVAEVARAYVEVRSLQLRLRIARKHLGSQSETLQLTEWRATAGLVTIQDVEQARANREQTLAQIPGLEISLAEAEHRLDLLLGMAPGTLHARLAPEADLPKVPSRVAIGIPADTLRQRPDIRAAERKLAAETARVGVAQAARYPSFKLSGSIGVDSLIQGTTGNVLGPVYSLLAGITAPLFNAGRLRHQMNAQEAVRAQALVAYEQAVLTALQEVENALVALSRNNERRETLIRAVRAALNASFLARQRYGAGVIDFQPVVDTERTVLTLEDSLANTRADEALGVIRLYKALGGGWSSRIDPRLVSKDAP